MIRIGDIQNIYTIDVIRANGHYIMIPKWEHWYNAAVCYWQEAVSQDFEI